MRTQGGRSRIGWRHLHFFLDGCSWLLFCSLRLPRRRFQTLLRAARLLLLGSSGRGRVLLLAGECWLLLSRIHRLLVGRSRNFIHLNRFTASCLTTFRLMLWLVAAAVSRHLLWRGLLQLRCDAFRARRNNRRRWRRGLPLLLGDASRQRIGRRSS